MDIDQSRLTESDPTGYMRFALAPLRVAPKEGTGWLFAAGELAMTQRTSQNGTSRSLNVS
jgi:hypothetical protein